LKTINKFSFLLLFALIIYFGGNDNVYAQEETTEWPIYIVQSGDILSSIANRFRVSVDSIVTENSMVNANQLFVGTELAIPGITWANGTLIEGEIPLGESYLSMKRAYGYSEITMMHLGDIVSPAQLSVGRSFLFANNQGEHLDQERFALHKSQNILGIAIENNRNPWEIVGENLLPGGWDIIPGDVLRIPKTDGFGPSGFPSSIKSVEIIKGDFVQGKTNVIRIATDKIDLVLSGAFMGNSITFNQDESGDYFSLFGPHVLAKPGFYPLEIIGMDNNGALYEFVQLVKVMDGAYGSESITVDPALLDDQLAKYEGEYLQSIISKVTPEKFWNGYFLAPTIYYDNINSLFGTRRSFNKSPYDYYHSGLDFGGGTGVEINAPANGVVVFSSPVELRGNLTIIDHGWGIFSGYSHQSELKVNVGDNIVAGQVIGLVGNTGRSSGAHLHWEMWAAGLQVDPMDWLIQEFP
jgi:murein DD-endopeptidase MepM/ murein hydrolase activator NlpD